MTFRPLIPQVLLLLGALASGHSSNAGLLLSEIHYNGPTPGSDPDEFIELANTGFRDIALDGFSFTSGVSFHFPEGSRLISREILVIARDEASFRSSFPGFRGKLFDFGGSLSNSGESLGLQDSAGNELWTVTYDDAGNWPRSADGEGDSLQLKDRLVDPTLGSSWFAGAPTPGTWAGLKAGDEAPPEPLPAPGTVLLTGLGILGFLGPRRRRRKQNGWQLAKLKKAIHLQLMIRQTGVFGCGGPWAPGGQCFVDRASHGRVLHRPTTDF